MHSAIARISTRVLTRAGAAARAPVASLARASAARRVGASAAAAGYRPAALPAHAAAAHGRGAWRGVSTSAAHHDVISSLLEDVTIPHGVPVTEFVLEHAASYGDRPAIVNGLTGDTITYAELPKRIGAAAAGLKARGFKAGDVLSVHLPNCPEYVITFHAVASLGGACTTSNPLYTASELNHQLNDSGATFALTNEMFRETVTEAAKGTGVTSVWCLEDDDSFLRDSWEDAEPVRSEEMDTSSTTLVLPYSSGTTGLPKGVVLSHLNVAANLAQICDHSKSNLNMHNSKQLFILPAFHIYGMVVVMNAGLRQGATLVTLPRFEPEEFLKTLQDHKITYAPLVPPLVLFLAKHPMVENYDLSSISTIFSGAAPLDADLQSAAEARLPGVSIRQGYGMTEMSPVSTFSPDHDVRAGSAGVLVPNAEARIINADTMEDVPHGERGELLVRGPHIMQGYLQNPEATAETITEDGWLRSGDIAYYDDDTGHFYVVDRLKELIKVKGFQVAPAELEGLLLKHPEIADCAVLGIPDERAGEVPKAFVVLAPGSEMGEEDVKAVLDGDVAEYKRLGKVEIVEAIPKSASGKILKRLLK